MEVIKSTADSAAPRQGITCLSESRLLYVVLGVTVAREIVALSAWVQLPQYSPIAPVVQLAETADLKSVKYGFKSRLEHQNALEVLLKTNCLMCKMN